MIKTLLTAGLAVSLASVSGAAGAQTTVEKPVTIDFSRDLDATMKALESHCTRAEVREFYPPKIPLAKETHAQIDCHGFDFMGKPRLAEFVFADNRLMLVWVLVDPEDQDRLIIAMREAYTSEGRDVGAAIAFPAHRTAYRFKPAEVLFYSEAAAPMFEARFGQK